MREKLLNLAVLASGSGTTLDFLIFNLKQSKHINIKLLITDNPQAGAIQVAKKYDIQFEIIPLNQFKIAEMWDQEIAHRLVQSDVNCVLLAGFLKKIGPHVINQYKDRIINSHPSLLPKYGGKGMYGRHVHSKVLEDNCSETGITIHAVNEHYDKGSILKQVTVKVEENDTVETLEERVKTTEKKALLEFLLHWDILKQLGE